MLDRVPDALGVAVRLGVGEGESLRDWLLVALILGEPDRLPVELGLCVCDDEVDPEGVGDWLRLPLTLPDDD